MKNKTKLIIILFDQINTTINYFAAINNSAIPHVINEPIRPHHNHTDPMLTKGKHMWKA